MRLWSAKARLRFSKRVETSSVCGSIMLPAVLKSVGEPTHSKVASPMAIRYIRRIQICNSFKTDALMNHTDQSNRAILQQLATKAMTDRGLLADFTPQAMAEAAAVACPSFDGATGRDLRSLLWASIDNDDSRDLDQLSVAEAQPDGRIKVFVAIADVDTVISGRRARRRARPAEHGLCLPRPPRSFPCCRNAFRPISHRWARMLTGRRSSWRWLLPTDGSVHDSGHLSGVGPQQGQAWLTVALRPGWMAARRPRPWQR